MSEPSSLYLKVHLEEAELNQFMQSQIEPSSKFTDWMEWFSEKKMYGGGITQDQINQLKYPHSVEDFIKKWLEYCPRHLSYQQYDQSEKTWQFSMLEFSENYLECIHFLHVLRHLASFKSIKTTDYILVRGYFWGPEPDITISLEPGQSLILSQAPVDVEVNFKKHMEERAKQIQAMYD